MLCLKDARNLLQVDYSSVEAGHGLTSDGMYHVAASTYMPGCSAEMIDWWFGFIHTTEQYKLWHVSGLFTRMLSHNNQDPPPLRGGLAISSLQLCYILLLFPNKDADHCSPGTTHFLTGRVLETTSLNILVVIISCMSRSPLRKSVHFCKNQCYCSVKNGTG